MFVLISNRQKYRYINSKQSFLVGCLYDGVVNLALILVLSLIMGNDPKDAGS
jgi:hypothetical protein